MREAMNESDEHRVVRFTYTNHRGETSDRIVTPISIEFNWTHWHPQPQWLLNAFCHRKQADRTFAMKDIQGWTAHIPFPK